MTDWKTITEAARDAGVSKQSVLRAIRSGGAKSKRGTREIWLVDPLTLAEYLRRTKSKAGRPRSGNGR